MLQGVQLTDEEAQACCALMDRDGDGKVVFEEVLEWWCSSSNIFRYKLPRITRDKQLAVAFGVPNSVSLVGLMRRNFRLHSLRLDCFGE